MAEATSSGFYLHSATKLRARRVATVQFGEDFNFKGMPAVTQNEGRFEFVTETKHKKVGIACSEPFECKLSFNLSEIANLRNCDFVNVALFHLCSYQHMGSIKAWIDAKPMIAADVMHSNLEEIPVIDSLVGHEWSQNKVSSLNHECLDCSLFLHIIIVDSEPKRKGNKFKLSAIHIWSY